MATIKLDENVPDSVAAILREGRHDVAVAREQQLAGVTDEELLTVASSEGRVLVTLDRDSRTLSVIPPSRLPASS